MDMQYNGNCDGEKDGINCILKTTLDFYRQIWMNEKCDKYYAQIQDNLIAFN